MEYDPFRIGKSLDFAILKSGKTKRSLASEIGVTPTTITDYTSGRSMPSLEKLIAMVEALECSLDEIIFPDKGGDGMAAETARKHAAERAALQARINEMADTIQILQDYIKILKEQVNKHENPA